MRVRWGILKKDIVQMHNELIENDMRGSICPLYTLTFALVVIIILLPRIIQECVHIIIRDMRTIKQRYIE